jgi:hypothetical protein
MRATGRVDGAVVAEALLTYSMVSLEDANKVLADGKIVRRAGVSGGRP